MLIGAVDAISALVDLFMVLVLLGILFDYLNSVAFRGQHQRKANENEKQMQIATAM